MDEENIIAHASGAGANGNTAGLSTSTAPILIIPKIGLTQKGKRKVGDPGQIYQIPLPLPPEFHDPKIIKVISKDNPYTDLPPVGAYATCTKKGLEHISGEIIECTIQSKILCEFEDEYGKIRTVDFADLELVSDDEDGEATTAEPNAEGCVFCPDDKKRITHRKCDLCKRWACLLHGKQKYWCQLCKIQDEKPYVHNSFEKEEEKCSRSHNGSCHICPGPNSSRKRSSVQCAGCKRWVCESHRFSKLLCLSGCLFPKLKLQKRIKILKKLKIFEENLISYPNR